MQLGAGQNQWILSKLLASGKELVVMEGSSIKIQQESTCKNRGGPHIQLDLLTQELRWRTAVLTCAMAGARALGIGPPARMATSPLAWPL